MRPSANPPIPQQTGIDYDELTRSSNAENSKSSTACERTIHHPGPLCIVRLSVTYVIRTSACKIAFYTLSRDLKGIVKN